MKPQKEPVIQQTHLRVEMGDKVIEGFVGSCISSGVWTFTSTGPGVRRVTGKPIDFGTPEPLGRPGIFLGVEGGGAHIHFSEDDGLRLAYALLQYAVQREWARQRERGKKPKTTVNYPRSKRGRSVSDDDASISVRGDGRVALEVGGYGKPRVTIWVPRRKALELAWHALDLLTNYYEFDTTEDVLSNHELSAVLNSRPRREK